MINPGLKYYFFTLCLVLTMHHHVNAQSTKPILKDSLKYTISYDSCNISLDTSIMNKNFWLELFSRDIALIAFFKQERKIDHFNIYISGIERVFPEPLTYQFRLFYSPILREKDIAKQLTGLGCAHYLMKIAPILQGKFEVSEVEFLGIEM